jgi:hypothetical protein
MSVGEATSLAATLQGLELINRAVPPRLRLFLVSHPNYASARAR